MPKVPRIGRGGVPSAVPRGLGGGPTVSAITEGFAAAADIFGVVSELGFREAAAEKKATAAQAKAFAAAAARKQALADRAEIGEHIVDLELGLDEEFEEFTTKGRDDPKGTFEAWKDHVEARTGQLVDVLTESNPAVGAGLAVKTPAIRRAALEKGFAWKQGRETQLIRGRAESTLQKEVSRAAGAQSAAEVGQIFVAARKKHGPLMVEAFGDDAEKILREAAVDMAESYMTDRMLVDPQQVKNEIKDGAFTGIGIKSTELSRWARKAELALRFRGENEKFRILGGATGKTRELVDSASRGQLDAKNYLAERRRNIKEAKLAAIDTSYTEAQRAENVTLIEEQGRIIDALGDIALLSRKVDPALQLSADETTLRETRRALTKLTGKKDLLTLRKLQRSIILDRFDRKISDAGYSRAMGIINVATRAAVELESDPSKVGTRWLGLEIQSPRQRGNMEMEKLLRSISQELTLQEHADAWGAYELELQTAENAGEIKITDAVTIQMARRAFSLHTGTIVKGIKF